MENASWPRNAIDVFVLARLEKNGLAPFPEADGHTLLRRLSLDLRGLPPTPEELAAFLQDTSPEAYERAIDRFLADPAYGERWARIWLDLARYADSSGYAGDPLREIWRYRDWVIDAYNRNLPFDEFTVEQIAGDLLPNATLNQRVATAFHRNTMTNKESGDRDEEFRVAAVMDRVETTMQVWMGLTMTCGRCDSHKYDPISQKEYYQLFACFNQTEDTDRNDEAPFIQAPTAAMLEEVRRVDARISAARARFDAAAAKIADKQPEWEQHLLAAKATPEQLPEEIRVVLEKSAVERSPEQKAQLTAHYVAVAPQLKRERDDLERWERARPRIPTLPVLRDLPPDRQRDTHVFYRGNYLQTEEKVEASVPQSFHRARQDAPRNRLGVARWLVDSENPLTARVAVNRVWANVFGMGMVETEEDFGTQGEPPSHPRLLDFLALEFGERRPDTKALLRLIVSSSTYRQSSRATSELLRRDPANRLLARGPRFRLEAELIRDQALALSGLLNRRMYGPSVYPPQPPGLWRAAFNPASMKWPTSVGPDRYRRGLYTFWRRTVPHPAMTTFDAPNRDVCTVRRYRTNTPLQALVTLNDPAYFEFAQALAHRIVGEGGSTDEERVRYAVRLCLSRPPDPEAVEPLSQLYWSERHNFLESPESASKLIGDAFGPPPRGCDAAQLAAWTVVANVLLNLDGVLTKS